MAAAPVEFMGQDLPDPRSLSREFLPPEAVTASLTQRARRKPQSKAYPRTNAGHCLTASPDIAELPRTVEVRSCCLDRACWKEAEIGVASAKVNKRSLSAAA